ncbi:MULTISPECIES: tRNA cyclic N6-threonylcarbamoyladenosine(37) synthase TcdA [Chromobacterium]|uniref:tRNA threonylcarbamoyladenosine dehydratase n=1 Tax=Chromobacterium haemolyticum TaxID=394935 RepID=A0A1W0D9F0_9NEIS|nr:MULTISPECIES: tRNA cyclic N6-threonylcarbamoyladenosine(37) synthase TcdA [Chromobacterium]OQS43645.1 tRNA threonylcarbamoyladenosine dehydratase [Chromobacterium haemolyticum]QOZ82519.1 tRNA cyclic N6-threonylcarbamoyladenosine(37) synthase TcdA [Chromobacterium sp. Rain0013]WON82569.1 tRNA cyclic N6-threonylcarbamoyladenosine(37) synthase TcdA [Chromobacterium haemolyticum]
MDTHNADLERRFGGIARLYGQEALARFQAAHVCVVGVGGVGSWAVEALARSAIGKLTLIDLDNVAESNTNRQLPALDPNYGMAKVTALADRARAINPACQVIEIEDFVTEDNLEQLLGQGYDFIIDCIDSLRIKTAMAAWCVRRRQPFIVSGGAGGQTDPTLIRVADLGEVTYDPLLSKLRYNLRRHHQFSREPGKKLHVPCVFSTEQLVYPDTPEQQACDATAARGPQGLSCAGFGAAMTVTASFGLVAVAQALKQLAKPPKVKRG